MNTFTPQEIITAYKAAYGQEADDLGEWLATSYCTYDRYDDLKAMVGSSGCVWMRRAAPGPKV